MLAVLDSSIQSAEVARSACQVLLDYQILEVALLGSSI